MPKTKTHEEYVDELKLINPNIVPIEEYIKARIPILHKCLIDGYEWNLSPSNALRGKGCLKCAGNMKLTNEEYIKRLSDIDSCMVPLEEYKGIYIPILHKCLIHNIEHKAIPSNVLDGHGCLQCKQDKISSYHLKLHEKYIEELRTANPSVIPLEKYSGNKIPILHKCLIHNIDWEICPTNALKGHGCSECHKERISHKNKKGNEEYILELSKANPEVIALETYVNISTPIMHKCMRHNYDWFIAPRDALKGHGCPMCRESIGERMVRIWLEANNVSYIYQYIFDGCKDTNTLPFDFYLPNYNCCMEYDGIQHFKPVDFAGEGEEIAQRKFEYTQSHDRIKNEYCKNNNINLIRIPYYADIEEELNNFLFI